MRRMFTIENKLNMSMQVMLCYKSTLEKCKEQNNAQLYET